MNKTWHSDWIKTLELHTRIQWNSSHVERSKNRQERSNSLKMIVWPLQWMAFFRKDHKLLFWKKKKIKLLFFYFYVNIFFWIRISLFFFLASFCLAIKLVMICYGFPLCNIFWPILMSVFPRHKSCIISAWNV